MSSQDPNKDASSSSSQRKRPGDKKSPLQQKEKLAKTEAIPIGVHESEEPPVKEENPNVQRLMAAAANQDPLFISRAAVFGRKACTSLDDDIPEDSNNYPYFIAQVGSLSQNCKNMCYEFSNLFSVETANAQILSSFRQFRQEYLGGNLSDSLSDYISKSLVKFAKSNAIAIDATSAEIHTFPVADIASAFVKGTYYDDKEVLDDYIKELDEIAYNFDLQKFLSPFVAVVQRSMVGKSSLAFKAGAHRFTVYANLNESQKGSAFPKSSPIVTEFLLATKNDERAFYRFCGFYLSCMIEVTDLVIAFTEYLETNLCVIKAEMGDNNVKTFAEQLISDLMTCFVTVQMAPATLSEKILEISMLSATVGNFYHQRFGQKDYLTNFWSSICDRSQTFSKELENAGMTADADIKAIKENADKCSRDFRVSVEKLGKLVEASSAFIVNCKSIYLHFDEARSLIQSSNSKPIVTNGPSEFTLLHHCRRAAALFGNQKKRPTAGIGFVVIVADTASIVANFVPQKKDLPKPSDRFTRSNNLHPPLWEFRLFDAAFLHDKKKNIAEQEAIIQKINSKIYAEVNECHVKLMEKVSKFGFPCWSKLIETGQKGDLAIFSLAKDKITNKQTEISDAVITALIGCRYYLEKIVDHNLNNELAARYMATILYITEDRSRCFTTYPSEPVLSEGAARAMLEKEIDFSLPNLLCRLNILRTRDLVQPGPRGEFVSRVLTVEAIQSAASSDHYQSQDYSVSLKVISVNHFLHSLIGDLSCNCIENLTNECMKTSKCPVMGTLCGQMSLENLEHLLRAVIFCNHAYPIDCDFKDVNLQEIFLRAMMIQCREGQPGIDEAIPIRFTTGTLAGRYSFVGIQSRNYASYDSKYVNARFDTSASNIGFTDWNMPYLILYYAFGYKTPHLYNLKYKYRGAEEPCSSESLADESSNFFPEANPSFVAAAGIYGEVDVRREQKKRQMPSFLDDNMAIVGILGLTAFSALKQKKDAALLEAVRDCIKTSFPVVELPSLSRTISETRRTRQIAFIKETLNFDNQ